MFDLNSTFLPINKSEKNYFIKTNKVRNRITFNPAIILTLPYLKNSLNVN